MFNVRTLRVIIQNKSERKTETSLFSCVCILQPCTMCVWFKQLLDNFFRVDTQEICTKKKMIKNVFEMYIHGCKMQTHENGEKYWIVFFLLLMFHFASMNFINYSGFAFEIEWMNRIEESCGLVHFNYYAMHKARNNQICLPFNWILFSPCGDGNSIDAIFPRLLRVGHAVCGGWAVCWQETR